MTTGAGRGPMAGAGPPRPAPAGRAAPGPRGGPGRRGGGGVLPRPERRAVEEQRRGAQDARDGEAGETRAGDQDVVFHTHPPRGYFNGRAWSNFASPEAAGTSTRSCPAMDRPRPTVRSAPTRPPLIV